MDKARLNLRFSQNYLISQINLQFKTIAEDSNKNCRYSRGFITKTLIVSAKVCSIITKFCYKEYPYNEPQFQNSTPNLVLTHTHTQHTHTD